MKSGVLLHDANIHSCMRKRHLVAEFISIKKCTLSVLKWIILSQKVENVVIQLLSKLAVPFQILYCFPNLILPSPEAAGFRV